MPTHSVLSRRAVFGLGLAIATTAGPVNCETIDLQRRIDRASRTGGDVIDLPGGDISVAQSIILRPDVVLRGARNGTTRLVAARPSMRVLDQHGGTMAGEGGLEYLSVIGFGDRMPSRGDERDRTVVMGPFRKGWCRNVEVAHSRWVSLMATGEHFTAEDCHIHHGYRDGIQTYNVEHVEIRRNRIDRIGDDGISVLISRNGHPTLDRSILIEDNQLSRCTGIKCLGAANAVIRKNRTFLIYGYGVFLGADPNFGEGYASENNILVADNDFLDTLGLSTVSSQRGIAVVALLGGERDARANDGSPLTHSNIRIVDNTMRQTIEENQQPLDLWWAQGATMPQIKTDLALQGGDLIRGIMVQGGNIDGLTIEGNTIDGFAEPITIRTDGAITRSVVRKNDVRRCAAPILVPATVRLEH